MKTLYIIAHTYESCELTIEIFFSSHKTIKRIGEIVDDGFMKPMDNGCPQEYLNDYMDWDNDGSEKKAILELEIIEV